VRRETDSSSARPASSRQIAYGLAGTELSLADTAGPAPAHDGLHGEAGPLGHDGDMAKPPESTKTSLRQRLAASAGERWPQLTGLTIRWHGQFAYVSGQLPDSTVLPLFRLRYAGSASTWGFAIYRASHDDYENSVLPSGYPAGTAQEALDCACGLYLGPHRLAQPTAPDELTGAPTSAWIV
jgi:hypothetical protein